MWESHSAKKPQNPELQYMHQVAIKKTPNPNLHDERLCVAVAWREARRYIQKPDLVVLVLLRFGDDERHHRFVFRLAAPLVHRRPVSYTHLTLPTILRV